jgi:hypothetical protein
MQQRSLATDQQRSLRVTGPAPPHQSTLQPRVSHGACQRDSIDHRPNGHDDIANCLAGVLVLADVVKKQMSFVPPFGASQPHFFPGSDNTAWASGPPGWPRNGMTTTDKIKERLGDIMLRNEHDGEASPALRKILAQVRSLTNRGRQGEAFNARTRGIKPLHCCLLAECQRSSRHALVIHHVGGAEPSAFRRAAASAR